MLKFIGIDLLENMEKIMKQNTRSYRSDFEVDRETLMNAAAMADTLSFRQRTYLWMSRPCGTWCVLEKHAFLASHPAHHIWEYYVDGTNQRILAYVVEVTGLENKKVMGNLYQLDYRKHTEFVKKASVPADQVRLVYEKGERLQDRETYICRQDDKVLGKFRYWEYVPNDSEALESVLRRAQDERRKMRSGKIEEHIRKLAA